MLQGESMSERRAERDRLVGKQRPAGRIGPVRLIILRVLMNLATPGQERRFVHDVAGTREPGQYRAASRVAKNSIFC